MRYQPKFVNGSWVVFDVVEYRNHCLCLLQRTAVERAQMLNRSER